MTQENTKGLSPRALRLRELRAATGKTLRELEEEIGMNYSLISMHENGLFINAASAHRYATYFNVPIAEFWTAPTLPCDEAPAPESATNV